MKSKPENGKILISLSRSVSLSLSNPPLYMHYALKQTTTKHGALSLKIEEKVSVLLRCFYQVRFFSIRFKFNLFFLIVFCYFFQFCITKSVNNEIEIIFSVILISKKGSSSRTEKKMQTDSSSSTIIANTMSALPFKS